MTDEKIDGVQIKKALNMWLKFIRAYSTYRKKASDHLKGFGFTTSQYMVIECLGHCGPLLTGELSKKTFRSGSNVTFVLDILEKANFIKRIVIEDDRRAILVQLTPEGQKLYNETLRKHGEFLENLAEVFTKEERIEFARILKKVGLALGDMP